MARVYLRNQRWVMVGLLIFVVAVTSGCEPFRKKFTRKKKTDISENQTIVILDPIDYPNKIKSAAELYQEHYSLWKVWQSDLEIVVDNNANEKKVRYTLGQIKEQLLAMQKLLGEISQKQMSVYLQELDQISAQFDRAAEFRNKVLITSQIHSLGRRIKDHLAPQKIKDNLITL